MISKALLFLLVNVVILTVDLTPSKLMLLFLVSILVLKLYKWVMGLDRIDKFAFTSAPIKTEEGVEFDLLSQFLSILLRNQQRMVHFYFIMCNLMFIVLAEMVPPLTLFLTIIDAFVIIELVKSLLEENRKRIRNKLGIKLTDSFYMEQKEFVSRLQVPRIFKRKAYGQI